MKVGKTLDKLVDFHINEIVDEVAQGITKDVGSLHNEHKYLIVPTDDRSCERTRSSGAESAKEMLNNSGENIDMDQSGEAELIEVVSTLYAKELKELGEARFNHKTEVQINSHREEYLLDNRKTMVNKLCEIETLEGEAEVQKDDATKNADITILKRVVDWLDNEYKNLTKFNHITLKNTFLDVTNKLHAELDATVNSTDTQIDVKKAAAL